ncbi:MAG: hypothetical protein QME79_12890 [Bacillota bacterium]|nr:hypothetical protein [Bacillota bacterium]
MSVRHVASNKAIQKEVRGGLFATALVAVALTLALAGCGGGGGSGPSFDPGVETAALEALVGSFEQGIEEYSLSGMTDGLSAAFLLTLREGALSYEKDLPTLRGELEADEENQLYWRQQYGYRLDLRLSDLTFSAPSATSASAACRFTVVEWAEETDPPVEQTITDQGAISWQFAKTGSSWRIAAMTITFEAPTLASARAARPAPALPGNPFFRRSW